MPVPTTLSRRSFLLAAGFVLARLSTACTRDGEAAIDVQAEPPSGELPTPEPAAAPVAPSPVPTPPPEPLSLTLPDSAVPQGNSLFAIVRGAGITGVQVQFAGRAYPAVADGGGWLALIGAGQRVGQTELHAPGVYPLTALVELDGGGSRALTGEVTITAARFPVEAIVLAPAESALLEPGLIELELAVLIPAYGGFTPARMWDGFFLRPVGGAITDVFGSRRSYNGGPATGSHSGVDFGAGAGAPVQAAASGRVALARRLPVRGNGIVIDHGAGVFTGYFHLSAIMVQPGQEVRVGETIGAVGSTGLATGPHLHWEVVVGGYHVNGLTWLQAPG